MSLYLSLFPNTNLNGNEDDLETFGYKLLSLDISYILMIYDLLSQILDPCLFITNEISSVEQLYTVAQSIITQNVAIYYS